MPSYYPEGDAAASTDGELRVLNKIAQNWYDLKGNVACEFPEGTVPSSTDNEDRVRRKIEIMKND